MKLQSGTYYIVETVAPAGYNVYGKVIEVEILFSIIRYSLKTLG